MAIVGNGVSSMTQFNFDALLTAATLFPETAAKFWEKAIHYRKETRRYFNHVNGERLYFDLMEGDSEEKRQNAAKQEARALLELDRKFEQQTKRHLVGFVNLNKMDEVYELLEEIDDILQACG